ncbi:MAG TPA: hypothetical protein DHW07_07930 [Gammaproteobacteria bacterium]|nr:hypothetical protein [Gammaproteobacteria bacterium]
MHGPHPQTVHHSRGPAKAVIDCPGVLLQHAEVPVARISAVVYGTTLVSNALIERCGAKIRMLVTTGFRDVLSVGSETHYEVFDLRVSRIYRAKRNSRKRRCTSSASRTSRGTSQAVVLNNFFYRNILCG